MTKSVQCWNVEMDISVFARTYREAVKIANEMTIKHPAIADIRFNPDEGVYQTELEKRVA